MAKGVLRCSVAKFTGKHLCQMPSALLKKRLRHRFFSCEFCDISKNTFRYRKVVSVIPFYQSNAMNKSSGVLLEKAFAGRCSAKKSVLKHFVKFPRKHLCRMSSLQFYKRYFGTGVFLLILKKIHELLRAAASGRIILYLGLILID